jgi:hypothetical protein
VRGAQSWRQAERIYVAAVIGSFFAGIVVTKLILLWLAGGDIADETIPLNDARSPYLGGLFWLAPLALIAAISASFS